MAHATVIDDKLREWATARQIEYLDAISKPTDVSFSVIAPST